MKEFKVFAGWDKDSLIEVLHSGLRNDSESETFPVRNRISLCTNEVDEKRGLFPCRFVKIVPLMAWGANFNYSIWFVELRGVCNEEIVQRSLMDFENV